MSSFNCPWCPVSYDNLQHSLRIHCQKTHKKSAKELYNVLFGISVCECGCGEETKFYSLGRGSARFAPGHSSRVINCFFDPDIKKKTYEASLLTRREMWKNGELKGWCAGLSKETDVRIAAQAQMQSDKILANDDERERRSTRMAKQWETGAIQPLTGSAHSQWQGGTSSIGQLSRSRLYKEWTYPHLSASGFKCFRCGSSKDLEVHHDQERFAEILHKSVAATGGAKDNDDWDGKERAAAWVIEYHLENDVSGVVLCEKCHEEEHA